MNKLETKKKEMAHKMIGGTKQRATHGTAVGGKHGQKTPFANKSGRVEGEFYRMTGNRPYEDGGERPRQAGKGMEKTKGEKATQANTKGSFKQNINK